MAGHRSWLWTQTDPFITTDSCRSQNPFLCSDTCISNAEILALLQGETRWTKPFFFPPVNHVTKKKENQVSSKNLFLLSITIAAFAPWITWGMLYHKLLLLPNAKVWVTQRMLKTKYFKHNIQRFWLAQCLESHLRQSAEDLFNRKKSAHCVSLYARVCHVYIIPTRFFLSFLLFWLGKYESRAPVKVCTKMMACVCCSGLLSAVTLSWSQWVWWWESCSHPGTRIRREQGKKGP